VNKEASTRTPRHDNNHCQLLLITSGTGHVGLGDTCHMILGVESDQLCAFLSRIRPRVMRFDRCSSDLISFSFSASHRNTSLGMA
jgi:hypothetical protein